MICIFLVNKITKVICTKKKIAKEINEIYVEIWSMTYIFVVGEIVKLINIQLNFCIEIFFLNILKNYSFFVNKKKYTVYLINV
jgi:hypothetical protein